MYALAMRTAVFTICSRNYLAYALTLQKSLQAYEPATPFFIYLADAPLDRGYEPNATIIPVKDLNIPDMLSMAFRYSVMEFNTAIKADCFLDLLTQRGFDVAIYLDPDIQVFGPLNEVHGAIANGASAVLTPHILGPLPDWGSPSEIEIMRSGIFNLGFAAFSAAEESLSFLGWWAKKLHAACLSEPEKGLFVDQRFMDFAPGFLKNLHILRHQGYNVAYWNLARRRLSQLENNTVEVNGQPLIFFHFSGVQPGNTNILSKHSAGGEGMQAGTVASMLMQAYQEALASHGHVHWASVPYAWAKFQDGSEILPPFRRCPPSRGTPEDWFSGPDRAWWNAPDPRVDQKKGLLITRLMMGFWELRADLREAYPLGSEAGRRGLHSWFHRHAVKEYGVGEVFLSSEAKSWLRRKLS
jgi:hypothetical protein